MMIFKPMSLSEAKELATTIRNDRTSDGKLNKIALSDLEFFTDGFTRDYGTSISEIRNNNSKRCDPLFEDDIHQFKESTLKQFYGKEELCV